MSQDVVTSPLARKPELKELVDALLLTAGAVAIARGAILSAVAQLCPEEGGAASRLKVADDALALVERDVSGRLPTAIFNCTSSYPGQRNALLEMLSEAVGVQEMVAKQVGAIQERFQEVIGQE